MEKRLKNIFKEEENKMNKLTKEINEAENLEKKSEFAELLLLQKGFTDKKRCC